MAVGTVNSTNTLNPAAQAAAKAQAALAAQPAAPQTVRVGEVVTNTQTSLTDKNARTYRHSCQGARFIMPDGLEVHFLGGLFTTSDPAIIAELDKVADKAASQIYTHASKEGLIAAPAKVAAADAAGPDIAE
jgi:hypothetical protein